MSVGDVSFVSDSLLDTGGSSSVIDLDSAKKLNLPMQMASASVNLGSCKGIGNGSIPYAARVPGPVYLRFGEDVVVTLPQLHVLDVKQQVLLVGTDVLQHRVGGWSFKSIGCDDQGDGRVVFVHRRSG